MRILGLTQILVLWICFVEGPSAVFAQGLRSSDVAVGNTARKLGASEWEWTIYVMGDDAALKRISCVTYLLHPTFENRSPRICHRGSSPGKGFSVNARRWGTFTVGITIDFQDRTQQRLTHELNFQAEAEGWAAITGTTVTIPVTASRLDDGHFVFNVNLASDGSNRKLESIDVRVTEDGSTLNTTWAFEILLDDQPWSTGFADW